MLVSSKIINPARFIQRKLPLNLKKEDEIFFQNEFTRTIPETKLLQLKDAIVTTDGIVIDNNKIVQESLLRNSNHEKWINYTYVLLTNLLKKKKYLPHDNYILAFGYWGAGYFHWMTEILPRFYAVKNLIKESAILIPQYWNNFYSYRSMIKSFFKTGQSIQETNFCIQTIKALHPQKIEFIPQNEYLKISNLFVPTYTADTGNYNEEIIRGLREHLLNFFDKKNHLSFGDKIYVSRAKAKRRKIINETEVINLLENHGFKTVFFEDYSFEEQVAISANTKYMIGLHGANLTNMLFMQPDSYVLELRHGGDINNLCYYSLSSSLNINYLYQFGNLPANYINNNYVAQNMDVKIDMNVLEKNVELMLSKKNYNEKRTLI